MIKYVKCSEIIDVRDGTHDSPKYTNEGGYPLITSKNIKDNKIDFENVNYISIEDYIKINERSEVISGDIIMPMIGTIGNPVLVNTNKKFAIKNVALFKLYNNEKVNSKFFYYVLKSENIINQLNKNKRGGTQNFVSLSNIRDLQIPLIDINKQINIVKVLDKAQELIDKRKEQIEALDELVKSQFIEMFGSPKDNPNKYDVIKLEEIIEYMGDIGSNGANSVISSNLKMSDTEDYALMVRTLNFTANDFTNNVKYVSKSVYEFFKKSKLFGGEIIFNKIGSAGINFIMPHLNRPASLGLNQIMLRTNTNINTVFLYNLLNTDYGKHQVSIRVQGAVTKSITKGAIKEIPIFLPPIELQNQFADFVKQVDKLKFDLQKSLKELEDNFNSLMQKAFKGELFKYM